MPAKKLTPALLAAALLTSASAFVAPPAQAAGVITGVPRANPYGAAVAKAPTATPRTQFVRSEIARMTGERDCFVGAYRSWERATSNHNTGNALDCTIPPRIGVYPNKAQRLEGWHLATWLRNNAARLQIQYLIWDGMIWHSGYGDRTWRTYRSGTGVTGGHHDHIHISVKNRHGD